jgi:hypothetical protein
LALIFNFSIDIPFQPRCQHRNALLHFPC